MNLDQALQRCPLVAILRGVTPSECLDVAEVLIECGFAIIEVPLNSPQPLESIERLARSHAGHALIGAGTVLYEAEVEAVVRAGGRLMVAPGYSPGVLARARPHGLITLPGFATPSEAFAALEAGADGLKLFPAEANPPMVLRALRAVLPRNVPVLPVGSISLDNMAGYWAAGANGFGLGSSLYRPGIALDRLRAQADAFREEIGRLRSA
ncbi:MAG: 2-dehydro-3-deoxy-6-phosphogalactonate aldolase [Burkholderiales bacterium]|nr:2-dehydro-3-deoxy-6-phosphogalactonate aldolase [Burkholderiales bacterium]